MGRVSAFTIDGLVLIFRSSDHHPPHFHVRCGWDWEIRVYIDTSNAENGLHYDYKFPKNPPRKFRGLTPAREQELLTRVIENRAALLIEWEEKVVPTELI